MEDPALPAAPDPAPGRAPVGPSDEALRSVLEAAFLIVAGGARARPPQPVPPALRPFLRFQRLPTSALGPVRRVVEADDELRGRVASVATEELVGRVAWLWVARPEGWEADLAEALTGPDAEGAADAAPDGDAHSRRAGAAARRSAAELAVARRELEQVRAQLADEREARRRQGAAAAEQARELAAARAELAELQTRLAEVSAREASERAGRAEALRHLAVLGEEVARLEATAQPPAPVPRAVEPEPAAMAERAERAGPPTVDVGAVGEAVARAADAAATLAQALAAAGHLLAGPAAEPAAARPEPAARPRPAVPPPVRRAGTLPGGLLADSVEAARHLVARPGAVVLVDGYNVSMAAWPGCAAAEQRTRLLDALDELAARTGVEPLVVFDGAEVDGPAAGTLAPRSCVRVRFSPPGVEADDVVLELVDQLPLGRTVLVVSSDRRVRDGARRRGAHVLSSGAFLELLGR